MDPLVLVFEDVTAQNYHICHDYLTIDSIHVVVEKIAKYHALSMVVAESLNSQLVAKYTKGIDGQKMRCIFATVMNQGKMLGSAVKTWPNFERIGNVIENKLEDLFWNYIGCYNKPSKVGFNVLNHGDFHIRNMMFKKTEEGVIQDVCFLDFQMPLYQSPGFDLVYMINATVDGEARKRKGEVFKMYHRELVTALKDYGYKGDVPSAVDVRAEILQMAAFGKFSNKFLVFHL